MIVHTNINITLVEWEPTPYEDISSSINELADARVRWFDGLLDDVEDRSINVVVNAYEEEI